jgi:hypothetical protein
MASIRSPFGEGPDTSNANVGAIPVLTGLTVAEYGNETHHKTVLTLAATPVGSPLSAASLGFGTLMYTLPAGAAIIKSSKFNLALQGTGTVDADTPDVGLGTVVASGAVATLDGTATFENIHTGQTFNDCNGTAEVKTSLATASPFALVIETAGAHTIYLNIADGWAGADSLLATGTITIEWTFVG